MLKSTLFAVSMAALAATTAIPAAAQDAKLKIGMTFQELNNPYFVSMQEALKEAAATLGAEVVVTDAGHDVTKQISDVEDMLQQGIDILLLNAAISDGADKPGPHGSKWSEALIVNHLAQHYLVHLLRDKLVESKSRVVFVSSGAVRQVEDPSMSCGIARCKGVDECADEPF